jgi:hypothetical protein
MAVNECEPDLVATPAGVLATTPRSHEYRIGVVAENQETARERFHLALADWRRIGESVSR